MPRLPPVRDAEINGHPDKFGQGSRLHLSHHLASMDLKCHLCDTEHGGSLLVEQTAHD
jgi:hypothetical protein